LRSALPVGAVEIQQQFDQRALNRSFFAVMRRMGISKGFTNNQHFPTAGFETLF